MKQFVWGAVFGASSVLTVSALAIDSDATKALDRLAKAIELTQAHYFQPVSLPDLADKAIDGMLHRLDPHSSYMTAPAYAAMHNNYARPSIGVTLSDDAGIIHVVAPIEGTPAAAAGLRAGDVILMVDNESTTDMPLSDVIDRLRGPDKSQVTLTLRHATSDVPLAVTLTRTFIIDDGLHFERRGDIGYIRISSLNENTIAKLNAALRQLQRQIGAGLKGYVVDLRNNPGGLLAVSVQVSDEFLTSGNIVSLRGRNPQDNAKYDASGGDSTNGKPIIVLVNQGTAAGAEIIAAALQDQKRAIVIGMRTFGGGTIQTILPLGDGAGAMRLTTAQFYRPSGSPIQVAGVTPDVLVAQFANDNNTSGAFRAREGQLHGHVPGEELQASPDIIRPETGKTYDDFQLSYALEKLNQAGAGK